MSSNILFLATLTVLTGRILSSPVTPVFHSAQGRHIRPIHCVNKATQESGICMFAWHCLKANGTHLGTCVDRFYFGSCCQIKEGGSDPETEKPSKTTEAEINPNSIESTNQVGIWPDDSSKFVEVTTKLPKKPVTPSTEILNDLPDRPMSTTSFEGASTKNLTGKPSKPVTSSPVTTKTSPSTVSLTLSQELITALPTIVSTLEPSVNITTEAPKTTSVLTSMLRSSTKAPITVSSSQVLPLDPVEITSHPEIPTDAKPVPVILNIQSSVPLGPITTLSSTLKPSTPPTNLQTDIRPPIKLEVSTSPSENLSDNFETIDNAQQIHVDIKVQSSFSPIEVTTSLNNEDTTLSEALAEDSTDSLYYEILSSTDTELLLNEDFETTLSPETAAADDTTLIAFTDTPEEDVSTAVPDVRPTLQAVIVQESTNQLHTANISQMLIEKTKVPTSVPAEAAIDSLLVETESETISPIETSTFRIDATTVHLVAENITVALVTKSKPQTAEKSTTQVLADAIPPLISSSTEISSSKVPDNGTEGIATDVSIKENNISSQNASERPTVVLSTIKPASSIVGNETNTLSSTVSISSNASSILSQSTEPSFIPTTETQIKEEHTQVHVTLVENKTNIIDTVNSIMNIVLNLNNSLVSNVVSSTTKRPITSDKPSVTKQPIEVTKGSTTISTTQTTTKIVPESTPTLNLTSIKIATSEKESVTLQSTPSSIPTTIKLTTKTAPTSTVALSEAPVKETTTTSITIPPTKPAATLTTTTTTTAEPTTTTTTTEPTTTTTTVKLVTTTTEPTTTTTEDFIAPYDPEGYKKICGRPIFPEPRIVNGQTAFFGQWPWQISLRQWKTATFLHKCGAALLNENWAITAAHCVDNVQPEDILLRLGEYDLASENEPYNYTERRVQIVASHPKFDPRTFEYDLALLRFYEPVQFQPNIIPICIPEEDRDYIGRTGFVTGWGRLYEDGPLPSKLQQVEVPVISNSECEGMYRSAGYVEHIPRNIFICAGYKAGKQDSCEGDSGGPMVIKEDGHWVLGGVISWGIGCAEPNQPGVYTRITEFKDWINQIIVF